MSRSLRQHVDEGLKTTRSRVERAAERPPAVSELARTIQCQARLRKAAAFPSGALESKAHLIRVIHRRVRHRPKHRPILERAGRTVLAQRGQRLGKAGKPD